MNVVLHVEFEQEITMDKMVLMTLLMTKFIKSQYNIIYCNLKNKYLKKIIFQFTIIYISLHGWQDYAVNPKMYMHKEFE